MRSAAAATAAAWIRCGSCRSLVYGKRLARYLHVCPECGSHHRLTAAQRIAQLVDQGSFEPLPPVVGPVDVLGFVDSKPYAVRLREASLATDLSDAVICGQASIGGHHLVMAVMDFRFMGGSLGSAVGESITQAAEHALGNALPMLIVTASGGARMQEGCLSLMQMAKTSRAVAALREAGLMSISLITDPTYGGVAASFGTNTDVIVAESGARMGFAGPRVIQQTIGQELPPGFQRAEFLLAHGQVDVVEERGNLRGCLTALLSAGQGRQERAMEPGAPVLIHDARDLTEPDPSRTLRLARQVMRPTTLDYLDLAFDSFLELRGDRLYGDCPAIVAGFAQLDGTVVAVVGHQKGHTTGERVARNFGMARPEGYRKAIRIMQLAADLGLPIVTLIDTPGAYPGIEAEERGQALAIAQSIQRMSALATPIIAVVTGEGGSGGALALAVADRVLALEHGFYSVISPEGCSAILWNTPAAADQAARALRITAPELLRLGVVDAVVPEPLAGAHEDHQAAAGLLRAALLETLPELLAKDPAVLVGERRARFRRYGEAPAGRPLAEEVA